MRPVKAACNWYLMNYAPVIPQIFVKTIVCSALPAGLNTKLSGPQACCYCAVDSDKEAGVGIADGVGGGGTSPMAVGATINRELVMKKTQEKDFRIPDLNWRFQNGNRTQTKKSGKWLCKEFANRLWSCSSAQNSSKESSSEVAGMIWLRVTTPPLPVDTSATLFCCTVHRVAEKLLAAERFSAFAERAASKVDSL